MIFVFCIGLIKYKCIWNSEFYLNLILNMITILIRLKEYRQIQKRNRKIENIRHFFYPNSLLNSIFLTLQNFHQKKQDMRRIN